MPFKNRAKALEYWRKYSKNIRYPKTKKRYHNDPSFRRYKMKLNKQWRKKHNFPMRIIDRLRVRAWRLKQKTKEKQQQIIKEFKSWYCNKSL